MQATLDASSLKALTKALTCLAKYGEELSIFAVRDSLSLSATNSSKSAYCRVKYDKQFFSRYRVGSENAIWGGGLEAPSVTGQLMIKSLLAIVKHKTVEKSVERCEITIIEPAAAEDEGTEEDSLESRLIIRLHCKHGVIKTHRVSLLTSVTLLAPGPSDAMEESRVTIGPKALRDLIDHFPVSKSAKADPQLVWIFDDSEVRLRTLESSIDTRGRGQLSTELAISAEEFDGYEITATPITLAFHLREFTATIAFADSIAVDLDLRFTDPAAPLFIDIGTDSAEVLFVISTSQVHGAAQSIPSQASARGLNTKKRDLGETSDTPARIKKPMKAAQRTFVDTNSARGQSLSGPSTRMPNSMPPPSLIPNQRDPRSDIPRCPSPDRPTRNQEPLFLPSSQASVLGEDTLRALGMDAMDEEQLVGMLEGEGEEFDFSLSQPTRRDVDQTPESGEDVSMKDPESFELLDDGDFALSQCPDSSKAFQPLFQD